MTERSRKGREDRRKKFELGPILRITVARPHYSLDRRGPRNAGIEFRLIDRPAIKRQSGQGH